MRRDSRRVLRGTTLLEVVAALAILGLAGASFVELALQQLLIARALQEREAQMRAATNVLARTVVWPASELRGRVGITMVDSHRVEIALVAPSLYSIAVLDRGTPSALLRTSRYAPNEIGDAR